MTEITLDRRVRKQNFFCVKTQFCLGVLMVSIFHIQMVAFSFVSKLKDKDFFIWLNFLKKCLFVLLSTKKKPVRPWNFSRARGPPIFRRQSYAAPGLSHPQPLQHHRRRQTPLLHQQSLQHYQPQQHHHQFPRTQQQQQQQPRKPSVQFDPVVTGQ